MKKIKLGTLVVFGICTLLTVLAFFAKDFVFYDFNMDVPDYAYIKTDNERPGQAETGIWYTYGLSGRVLQYGLEDSIAEADIQLYALSDGQAVSLDYEDTQPFREDLAGNFIAVLPARELDIDGDGEPEIVHDATRADLSHLAFNPVPQRFLHPDIPFELVFAERKYMMVYFEGQLVTDTEIIVTSSDGERRNYYTNQHGWISGLPIKDIRNGFTASYSLDGRNIYRMYYALEDYSYFTPHFWAAHTPILLMLLFSAIGIVLCQLLRRRLARNNPDYPIYTREKVGLRPSYTVSTKTSSRFLLIRWLLLIAGMFLWTYAGKLINQGQLLNDVAVPVFTCPFNLDQVLEAPCYYMSHLPALFTRFGPDFPIRNMRYAAVFLISLFLFLIFFGRILCGFLCPAGLLQDVMDKIREALHIRPIPVTDRMIKLLQPVKWMWIILFLGFAFVGGDFCDICPLKGFTTGQGGYWTNLYLGGFIAVIILTGSFFIKRFWCIICPMGYIMGLFKRFNLFKLKKDCTACTECGACYEACPMRIKTIYTERQTPDVQTVDCLMCGECINKCPEDNALSMTLCGKPIYKASKETFLSRYAHQAEKTKKEVGDSNDNNR